MSNLSAPLPKAGSNWCKKTEKATASYKQWFLHDCFSDGKADGKAALASGSYPLTLNLGTIRSAELSVELLDLVSYSIQRWSLEWGKSLGLLPWPQYIHIGFQCTFILSNSSIPSILSVSCFGTPQKQQATSAHEPSPPTGLCWQYHFSHSVCLSCEQCRDVLAAENSLSQQ